MYMFRDECGSQTGHAVKTLPLKCHTELDDFIYNLYNVMFDIKIFSLISSLQLLKYLLIHEQQHSIGCFSSKYVRVHVGIRMQVNLK